MSAENRQGKRITLEFLREEVLSHRWRGCALHSWMRKGYQKLNGIKDWPEEECRPPKPSSEELTERRRLVESVLALVDDTPDEETMQRLDNYMQGKFDDQLWFTLRSLLNPNYNGEFPKPPPAPNRTQRSEQS